MRCMKKKKGRERRKSDDCVLCLWSSPPTGDNVLLPARRPAVHYNTFQKKRSGSTAPLECWSETQAIITQQYHNKHKTITQDGRFLWCLVRIVFFL